MFSDLSRPSDSRRRSSGTTPSLFFWCVVALLLVTPHLFSGQVGTLDYFEGSVALIGETETLDEWDLFFGAALSEGEVLETGNDGNAEVVFDQTDDSVVHVGPNTAYSVSVDTRGRRPKNTVDLFFGRLGVRTGRGNADLEVRNGTSVAGVRGTVFDVATAANGSVLVHVESGSVEVENRGRKQISSPGRAVQIAPDGALTGLLVSEDERDTFVEQWIELRNEAFRANPAFFLEGYANRLPNEYRRFENSARQLAQHREDLERAATGSSRPSMGDTAMLRARVAPAVNSVRNTLFLFEESYASVTQLISMLEEGRHSPEAEISSRVADFLEFVAEHRNEMLRLLGQTRYLLSLYDRADFSITPGGLF